jgi:membrane protein YqaA with SNARE-associated domain
MFKSVKAKLLHFLVLYGGWGLFGISFLDSSFVPFPVFNDFVLILFSSRNPRKAILYALLSTMGSVLGCFVLYFIARGGGEVLWRAISPAALARAKRWLERNDFVTMLVACLLPPPAPLKIFVIMAGILEMNPAHFGVAMLIGRAMRFGADAWLGVHYGPHAEAYLRRNAGWASLAAVVLVVVLTLLSRRLARLWTGKSASTDPGVTSK